MFHGCYENIEISNKNRYILFINHCLNALKRGSLK